MKLPSSRHRRIASLLLGLVATLVLGAGLALSTPRLAFAEGEAVTRSPEVDETALQKAFRGQLVRHCWIKPTAVGDHDQQACAHSGDFDGDMKTDRAILVKERAGKGRSGIAILFGNGKKAQLGAGNAVGNGGTDFSWLDTWRVIPHVEATRSWGPGRPPSGDALLLEKSEAASGLVGWNGGRFRWQQQSD